jgi:tetratricopeptide (TPR) repeat protein
VVGVAIAAVVAAALLLMNRETPAVKEAGAAEVERLGRESIDFMRNRDYREARKRLQALLDRDPGKPQIHLLMGRCLVELQYYEAALGHLQIALNGLPEERDECRFFLGVVLKNVGRIAQAVAFFEPKFADKVYERQREFNLAECYLDLERYGEALALLERAPLGGGTVYARFKALSYQGKADEARALIASLDAVAQKDAWARATQAGLRAAQFREEGRFEEALKTLEEAVATVEPGSREAMHLRRASLAILIESGDGVRLETAAVELEKAGDPKIRLEATWNRAVARLLAGRREAAVEAAREFLASADPEYTPLRWERIMMRHLAGELKDADVEAEAKSLPRARANDLLYYLALATGDRTWAAKALEATPGRNFPYHAIRRLLGR